MGLLWNPLLFFWCVYWVWPRKPEKNHEEH